MSGRRFQNNLLVIARKTISEYQGRRLLKFGMTKHTVHRQTLIISSILSLYVPSSFPVSPHRTTLRHFETSESMGILLLHRSWNRVATAIAILERIAPDGASWPNVVRRAYWHRGNILDASWLCLPKPKKKNYPPSSCLIP